MKHNESGTHIKIGMYRKNGYIYILVADSGRRIPGELAEHLFEPFTKGDVSRKSGSGSGLGLSIAKKIIEMHGFQMDFYTTAGREKNSADCRLYKRICHPESRTTATTHPSRHGTKSAGQ